MPTASARISATAAKRTPLVITIDGPAGAGKSTAARLLAKRLGLWYLDTGATYRVLAYAAMSRGIDVRDSAALVRLSQRLRLSLRPTPEGLVQVLLDGSDVTRSIRTERVTEAAAVLAQHSPVRHALVRLQRKLARGHPIVAEGRDTGSVVFPRAACKFFLTAQAAIRAKRRQHELRALYGRAPAVTVIVRQLRARDRLDRLRTVGPLVKPRGAVVLETSRLGAAAVVERMLRHLTSE